MRKLRAVLIALLAANMCAHSQQPSAKAPERQDDFRIMFAAHPEHAAIRPEFVVSARDALATIMRIYQDDQGNLLNVKQSQDLVEELRLGQQSDGEWVLWLAISKYDLAQTLQMIDFYAGVHHTPLLRDQIGCYRLIDEALTAKTAPLTMYPCDLLSSRPKAIQKRSH